MNKHTFQYTVRHDDLDFMGIIGNAEWVTILTRARIELLDRIEYPITKMIEHRLGAVVSEMTVKYIKTAYLDDVIQVSIEPTSLISKGLILRYSVRNQKNQICLTADVAMIFINHEVRATGLPAEIAHKLFGETILSRAKLVK